MNYKGWGIKFWLFPLSEHPVIVNTKLSMIARVGTFRIFLVFICHLLELLRKIQAAAKIHKNTDTENKISSVIVLNLCKNNFLITCKSIA